MFRQCRQLHRVSFHLRPIGGNKRASCLIFSSFSNSSTSDSDDSSPTLSPWNRLKKLFNDFGMPEKISKHTKKTKVVVDSEPTTTEGSTSPRLPKFFSNDEFSPEDTAADRRRLHFEANRRIVRIAVDRVLEPSAVALLTISTSAVLGIAIVEASMLTVEMPFIESMDAGRFVLRYAVEQLLPSCHWATRDAKLIATAVGLDANTLLQNLDPQNLSATDAATLLRVQMLSSCRCMAAGFMLLAQLVRAGTIGAAATGAYEDRIKAGREPPLLPRNDGLILRLCGRRSNVTSASLQKMGRHLFPVFEEPDRLHHLLSQYSDGAKIPIFWRVRPGRYGSSYSWRGLHFNENYLIQTKTNENVLILEADATNGDDPLALGDVSLDLTIDDASQGFRRVIELFQSAASSHDTTLPPFRPLRVFLGNSLETFMSGGGHEYTLRHRIRYANEVDVLIDSRAPVLKEILHWCDRVAGEDRVILFQTSNRQYFLSLQLLMKHYGYKICDPLDWTVAKQLREETAKDDGEADVVGNHHEENDAYENYESLLQILLEDRIMESIPRTDTEEETVKDALETVVTDRKGSIMMLSRLPRLVYYDKTAETLNAVEALLKARAVDISSCCALLDRQEGAQLMRGILKRTHTEHWTKAPFATQDDDLTPAGHGLHMISSSAIYDALFRQVRQWTRMGYSALEIQKELDTRYHQILKQSQEVYEAVVEVTASEEPAAADTEAVPIRKTSDKDDIPLEEEDDDDEVFERSKKDK